MEIQEIKKLLLDLDKPNSPALDEVKGKLVKYASKKEMLIEFLNILCSGSKEARINVVDILSNVFTEQSFKLLIYALHDPHSSVCYAVAENLEKQVDLDRTLFWVEEYLTYEKISNKAAREGALLQIREYEEIKGREYFLPLIKKYITANPSLDLTVRGNLLSVLAIHGDLEGVGNLIEVMKYGSFDGKLYATKKLGKILNDEVINENAQKVILDAMSEAIQQEHLPDITWLLDEYLHHTKKSTSVFSSIRSSSDWIKEAVLYFRKLGFYQEYSNLSDDELVRKIKDACEYIGDEFFHNHQLVTLLAEDKSRTWTDNGEDFIQDYVKILNKWGEISYGNFVPKNITQTKDEAERITRINFEINEKKIEIQANIYKNGIDMGVLEAINETLIDNQIQFDKRIQFCCIGDDNCIVSLTAAQKRCFEKDLGLKFSSPGRYILPPNI